MHTFSAQYTRVRPELEHITEYTPGESLESFSKRTGIPVSHLIKLNSNESPYEPAPAVKDALGSYCGYNSYPDTNSADLRAALAQYTGIDSELILVNHGSMELINLLWHLFLSVGDTIICCPPTFSLYTLVTTLCGASVVEVPRTPSYEVDVQAILAALTPRTKMIVLCSPNNPTGNPVREDDVHALLETGRIVMIDEAYIEFADQPQGLAHLVPLYENLVVIRTLSKWAGLAGLRVGYGVFPEWIATAMRHAQCPFEVNSAGHIAAIETLKHLDYTLDKVQRIVEERTRLFHMLANHSYLEPIPSQGNFVLVHVKDDQIEIARLRAVVERHGILLRYFQHPDMRDFLRVTVGLPQHTDALHDALARVN